MLKSCRYEHLELNHAAFQDFRTKVVKNGRLH